MTALAPSAAIVDRDESEPRAATAVGHGLKVAYFVNQYPKVSHSFIRREIQALERQGVAVQRFALRGWNGELVDPDDLRERERTCYVLRGGARALLPALAREALRSPLRFAAALGLAFRMGRRAHRSLPFHLAYLAEACWLASRLRAAGVQHLHAHFGTNAAEVAMFASALCGVPYSFTVHGAEEFDRPESLGLGEKIRRSAFVVAISAFGRSQIFRWVEPAHWHKVKVVHCGLERAFHDVPPAAMPERPRLVCVGRLIEQKGLLLLVEAAAALAREGVYFDLVLAGDGEARARIEDCVARHGLKQQVRITGWISSARVREEIQAATALVLPSFAEGLPVVVMEAMALCRPVLATYIAGIPELVVHGETGWLFPAGAPGELVAALKSCLGASSAALARMGRRARERVLARHDADLEAARLVAHFRAAVPAPEPAGEPG